MWFLGVGHYYLNKLPRHMVFSAVIKITGLRQSFKHDVHQTALLVTPTKPGISRNCSNAVRSSGAIIAGYSLSGGHRGAVLQTSHYIFERRQTRGRKVQPGSVVAPACERRLITAFLHRAYRIHDKR